MKDCEVTRSGLCAQDFVTEVDGKKTELFVLTNESGCELTLSNYGARIVSLVVPDRSGKDVDVVLGHSSIAEYLNSQEPYFGATCGRFANRIAKGRFEIDGTVYDRLAINNGPNSLHGGVKGFTFQIWDAEQIDGRTVCFKYLSRDGEEGFPGNLSAEVAYHLTDDNSIEIGYRAVTDKPTVVNLTNHAFFNLSGEGPESVHDHLLTIHADKYIPIDETSIPYGRLDAVAGTPMDFTAPHTIGERIDTPTEQLQFARGYDHSYVLNDWGKGVAHAARCVSPKTGIALDVYTTEPGVQLYTTNWMNDHFVGKHGKNYKVRCAFCLETQHFPDSPNRPEFPSVVLRPGETFESSTVFKFSVEK